MNALTPISMRLAKLLPMLSSDKDGEVVAAARAVGRTLASAGLDWHALADTITAEPTERVVVLWRDRPSATHAGGDWYRIALWCQANNAGQLNERERVFVGDMVARLVFNGRPTERQANWLRSIHHRLQRGATAWR